MNDRQQPFPSGPNVGTQLRALRAKKAREDRKSEAEGDGRQRNPRQTTQLALPSADGWFAAHGCSRFEFQRDVWQHSQQGAPGCCRNNRFRQDYAVWFALLIARVAEKCALAVCACCG